MADNIVLSRPGHDGAEPPPGSAGPATAEPGPAGTGLSMPAVANGAAGGAPAARRPPASRPAVKDVPVLRITGIALLLLGGFVLGFAGYLFGPASVQEARMQTEMYTALQNQLALGTAPVGPASLGKTVPAGAPMAILNIPRIGIKDMIVVQGTSPQNLMLGPGHRRDSPLPGQGGVSEIYGRRATFGGPFASIGRLRPGDQILVTTGQGRSTYVVAAVAQAGETIQDPAPDRLLLMTASSALIPSYSLTVDARLTSRVDPSPGVTPLISFSELPLADDPGTLALTETAEWALALALVSGAGTVAALRWSRWAAYLAMAPLALAVLWNLYQSLAALLPNLY